MSGHPVAEQLYRTLREGDANAFDAQLSERLRQLDGASMIDGRVLPAAEATQLRSELCAVSVSALPELAARDPFIALRVATKVGSEADRAAAVTALLAHRPHLADLHAVYRAQTSARFSLPVWITAFASATGRLAGVSVDDLLEEAELDGDVAVQQEDEWHFPIRDTDDFAGVIAAIEHVHELARVRGRLWVVGFDYKEEAGWNELPRMLGLAENACNRELGALGARRRSEGRTVEIGDSLDVYNMRAHADRLALRLFQVANDGDSYLIVALSPAEALRAATAGVVRFEPHVADTSPKVTTAPAAPAAPGPRTASAPSAPNASSVARAPTVPRASTATNDAAVGRAEAHALALLGSIILAAGLLLVGFMSPTTLVLMSSVASFVAFAVLRSRAGKDLHRAIAPRWPHVARAVEYLTR